MSPKSPYEQALDSVWQEPMRANLSPETRAILERHEQAIRNGLTDWEENPKSSLFDCLKASLNRNLQ